VRPFDIFHPVPHKERRANPSVFREVEAVVSDLFLLNLTIRMWLSRNPQTLLLMAWYIGQAYSGSLMGFRVL